MGYPATERTLSAYALVGSPKSIVSMKALTKSVKPNVSSENLRAYTHVRLRVEELLPGILAPDAPVDLRRPYRVTVRFRCPASIRSSSRTEFVNNVAN